MKILSAKDIISNVVDAITPTITIDSWVHDPLTGEFEVFACDTFYLLPCKQITIDTYTYEVVSIVQDVSFIIKPVGHAQIVINVDAITLYTPFFFHGTPIAVNNVLTAEQFDTSKTPAVYLWETLREVHNEKSSGNPIALEADLRIFFLDSAQWEDWTPEQHYDNVIDPMKALLHEFTQTINNDRANFMELESFTTIPRANFGSFQRELGVMESYFNDMMSGVELQLTIRYKSFVCNERCTN